MDSITRYQPLTISQLKSSTLKSITDNESKINLKTFAASHQMIGVGNYQMTLHELSSLLVGDSLLNQFDIIPGKVENFLCDKQTGFLNVHKLYDNIVIGVVSSELEEIMNEADTQETFISLRNDLIVKEINALVEDGFSEFMFTSAGRHRITGLLTLADQYDVNANDILINVDIRVYQSWEDAALSVLCANKSRSMTPAERSNCILNSKGIDTNNKESLATYANTGTRNAKEAFSIACSTVPIDGVTRNTVATIAKSFITELGKTTHGRRIISYLNDSSVLESLVSEFTNIFKETVPIDGNIARGATLVGKNIYRGFSLTNSPVNDYLPINKDEATKPKKGKK